MMHDSPNPDDPMLNHRQIDTYHIQERMQDGGMSMVYQAFDTHRQQEVVVKVLHDRYVNHPEVVRRFEREIEIAKELHHTHIVPFFGFGYVDDRPYIALKHMPGGSLRDLTRRQVTVPISDVARWLEQVASALDYAHKRGVIHRDIKPGNVLLDAEGDACLADFGIARVEDASQLTRTDAGMPGTARFMSPEQAVGTQTLDVRSDVYSLAVLAYLLVAGDYPFDGPNDVSIILQHVDKQPPRPSQVNPALPRALDKVILKGMDKKPERRYASAGAFAAAFREIVADRRDLVTTPRPVEAEPAGDSRSTVPPSAFDSAQGAPTPRGRPRRVLQGAVILALLGGIGVFAAVYLPGLVEAVQDNRESNDPQQVVITATPSSLPTSTPTPLPTQQEGAVPPAPGSGSVPQATADGTPVDVSPVDSLPSVTPEPTLEVPNGWDDGTQLFVQEQTGISLFVGGEPVNPEQFQPGEVVTISRGIVEGNEQREWYGGPDAENRWWHIALPEGGGGWLPESALGEEPPPLPPTPENTESPAGATATPTSPTPGGSANQSGAR